MDARFSFKMYSLKFEGQIGESCCRRDERFESQYNIVALDMKGCIRHVVADAPFHIQGDDVIIFHVIMLVIYLSKI